MTYVVALCGLSARDKRLIEIGLSRAPLMYAYEVGTATELDDAHLAVVDANTAHGRLQVAKMRMRNPALVVVHVAHNRHDVDSRYCLARHSLLSRIGGMLDAVVTNELATDDEPAADEGASGPTAPDPTEPSPAAPDLTAPGLSAPDLVAANPSTASPTAPSAIAPTPMAPSPAAPGLTAPRPVTPSPVEGPSAPKPATLGPVESPSAPALDQNASDVADAAPDGAGPAPVQGAPSPIRALVIDDSRTVRELLCSTLQDVGIVSDKAEDGDAAMRELAANSYDIVFLDVVMPGTDGYEVCRNIKRAASTRSLPVVMLTSSSSPFDRTRGALAGCDSYLTKPITRTKFLASVDEVLTGQACNDRVQLSARGYQAATPG